MQYAVIDIGSNTVKCTYFSYENTLKSIDFKSVQLGIIGRIKDGILEKQDISLLCETINGFISHFETLGSGKAFAFATESLRKVSNLDDVTKAVKENCSIDIELISGSKEAKLSFTGSIDDFESLSNGILVDMGGGSTEIVAFKDKKIVATHSFKFGCLWLKNNFVEDELPTQAECQNIKQYVLDEISKFDYIKRNDNIVFIGGTGNAISRISKKFGFSNNNTISMEELDRLFKIITNYNEDTIKFLNAEIPQRVYTIMPGISAYKAISEYAGVKTIYFTKKGIREGFLKDKLNI